MKSTITLSILMVLSLGVYSQSLNRPSGSGGIIKTQPKTEIKREIRTSIPASTPSGNKIIKTDTKSTGVLGRTYYRGSQTTSTPEIKKVVTSSGSLFSSTPPKNIITRSIPERKVFIPATPVIKRKIEAPKTVIVNQATYVNNHSQGPGYYSHMVHSGYHDYPTQVIVVHEPIFINSVSSIPASDTDYSNDFDTITYGKVRSFYTKAEFPDLFIDVVLYNGEVVCFATQETAIMVTIAQLKEENANVKLYSIKGFQGMYYLVGIEKQ